MRIHQTLTLTLALTLLPAVGAAAPDAQPTTKVAQPTAATPVAQPTAAANPLLPPGSPGVDDPAGLLKAAVSAFQGNQWALGFAFVVMLLTWVVGRFLSNVFPVKVLPWVSIGLGVVLQVILLIASGQTWWAAVLGGLLTGTAASGLWSAVGKHLAPAKKVG